MFTFSLALVIGLAILIWSADQFVEGASQTAKHFGMSPLLIGMIIVGFGTSVPEMLVSAISALEGSPGIALGNAFGSNITNIALILGVTALIKPIGVSSQIIKSELPILFITSCIVVAFAFDNLINATDSIIYLVMFFIVMGWSIYQNRSIGSDSLKQEFEQEIASHTLPLTKALSKLTVGLVLLIVSSRALVWAAVGMAKYFGVSDLIIGLTIVAVGTSLPELAASIMAAKKNEPDIVIGNIIGSNLFNTMGVVGIAGIIAEIPVDEKIIYRDMGTMLFLTALLFLFAFGFRGARNISRFQGASLLLCYIGYNSYLLLF